MEYKMMKLDRMDYKSIVNKWAYIQGLYAEVRAMFEQSGEGIQDGEDQENLLDKAKNKRPAIPT